jgi:ubiquinone/menaquinone biosynthesis C-methylase UbiE
MAAEDSAPDPSQQLDTPEAVRAAFDELLDKAGPRSWSILYVAAKLDLAGILRDEPQTSDALAQVTRSHPRALLSLLRGLAGMGILTHEADGRFGLAPIGQPLRGDFPGSRRDDVILDWEIFLRADVGLLEAVKDGASGFSHVFGHSLFEHLAQHPDLSASFDAMMVNISNKAAEALVAAYDFSAASRIVDVGGGSGALLAAILKAVPQATGVVFDLPGVAAGARSYLASVGVIDRCDVMAGDFLSDALPAADMYLLSHVLHNWDDAHCVTILRNCQTTLASEGRVVICDLVIPERIARGDDSVMADVAMLSFTGGCERSEAEFRALLADAGLELTRIVPTADVRSLVEARPARG